MACTGQHERWKKDQNGNFARNARTVWTITTQARPDAHFATFPDELPRRCIKAGTSERGCCPVCGAPWERVVECSGGTIGKSWHPHENDAEKGMSQYVYGVQTGGLGHYAAKSGNPYKRVSTGWQPTCTCGREDTLPCVVLDPFMGSGTVAEIARELNRSSIGIELSPAYIKIIRNRLQAHSQLDTGVVRYNFEKVPE